MCRAGHMGMGSQNPNAALQNVGHILYTSVREINRAPCCDRECDSK